MVVASLETRQNFISPRTGIVEKSDGNSALMRRVFEVVLGVFRNRVKNTTQEQVSLEIPPLFT